MSKPLSFRFTLPYKDLDEFEAKYASNITADSIFLPTSTPQPADTMFRFELVLATGARVLRGEGLVLAVREGKKPGMDVRFISLDVPSRTLVDRIMQAQSTLAMPVAVRPEGDSDFLEEKTVIQEAPLQRPSTLSPRLGGSLLQPEKTVVDFSPIPRPASVPDQADAFETPWGNDETLHPKQEPPKRAKEAPSKPAPSRVRPNLAPPEKTTIDPTPRSEPSKAGARSRRPPIIAQQETSVEVPPTLAVPVAPAQPRGASLEVGSGPDRESLRSRSVAPKAKSAAAAVPGGAIEGASNSSKPKMQPSMSSVPAAPIQGGSNSSKPRPQLSALPSAPVDGASNSGRHRPALSAIPGGAIDGASSSSSKSRSVSVPDTWDLKLGANAAAAAAASNPAPSAATAPAAPIKFRQESGPSGEIVLRVLSENSAATTFEDLESQLSPILEEVAAQVSTGEETAQRVKQRGGRRGQNDVELRGNDAELQAVEEARRALEEERRALESERRALEQERRAVEERRALEKERRALEQERRAVVEARRAEQEALRELEASPEEHPRISPDLEDHDTAIPALVRPVPKVPEAQAPPEPLPPAPEQDEIAQRDPWSRAKDYEKKRASASRMVFAGAALGSTAFYALYTVAPLVAKELTGSDSWAGVPGASALVGVAAGSTVLATVMAKKGRRAGLRLGFFVGLLGTIAATAAIFLGAPIALMIAAMLFTGFGHASNQLSRFAVADMYPPEKRASALGTVVWAGTIGAIVGPNLIRAAVEAAAGAGVKAGPAGYGLSGVFFICALGATLLLRPDPTSLVPDEPPAPKGEPTSLLGMWKIPHVRVALVSMVLGQVSMVFLMTVTPVHVKHCGHGLGAVGLVMAFHFAGMFAFSPMIGKMVPKLGSAKMIIIGMAILIVASLGAAYLAGTDRALIALFLCLLGLGWSFAFVAGSALLTKGLSYAARVRLQGGIDTVVWGASAASGLSSGVILGQYGFAVVSVIGGTFALGPVVLIALAKKS